MGGWVGNVKRDAVSLGFTFGVSNFCSSCTVYLLFSMSFTGLDWISGINRTLSR